MGDSLHVEHVLFANQQFLGSALTLHEEALFFGPQCGRSFTEFVAQHVGTSGGDGVDAVVQPPVYLRERLVEIDNFDPQ